MFEVQEIADGCYEIRWYDSFGGDTVDVYAGTTPDAIDLENAVASDQAGRAIIEGLTPSRRHYFALIPQSGAARTVAQRDVPFEGAVNYRDLGGYRTAQDRVTKWGTLFRSGHLSRLTLNDQRYFEQLGIKTICDFRRVIEIENERSSIPPGAVTHNVPITPGARDADHIAQLFAGTDNPEDVVEAMVDIMRSLIVDAAPQYKQLFDLLLAHHNGSFLMNCSAGKERTGVGAALVLMALGVPRETIEYDFMLSGDYYPVELEVPRVREKYAVKLAGEAGRALIMPLLEARVEYIRVVFEEIDKRFGSDEQFIRDTYEIGDRELQQLRDKFTE